MLSILVIPHSNAEAERVFSMVRKNDTAFRPTLGTEVLQSLMITKIDNVATETPCFKEKYSSEFFKEGQVKYLQCTKKSKQQSSDSATDSWGKN